MALLVEGLAALGLVVPSVRRAVELRGWPYTLLATTYSVGLVWLVVYAAGDDSYFAPDQVSRWEYASRNGRSWVVVLAVVVTLVSVFLSVASRSTRRSRLRRLVVPSAVIAPFSIIAAAVALTEGH